MHHTSIHPDKTSRSKGIKAIITLLLIRVFVFNKRMTLISCLRWIFLLISFFIVRVKCATSDPLMNSNGTIFKTLSNIGPSACNFECARFSGNCLTFYYDYQHFVCYLYEETSIVTSEGVYPVSFCKSNSISGKCSNRSCPKDSVCSVLTQSSSDVCIETPCDAGSFRGKNECEPCRAGYYQDKEFQNHCKPCAPGSYSSLTGSTSCEICPLGAYQDQQGGDACRECPAGSYQDQQGETVCKECPAGSYQDQQGETVCKECPAGSYQDQQGGDACRECPAGSYQDQQGETVCKECPAGSYQDQQGEAVCRECPAGSYQDQQGEDVCKECPTGSFQDSYGQDSCIPCSTGEFQSETGKTSCNKCPSGTFQDKEGQIQCLPCEQGHNHNGETDVMYSKVGWTECRPCLSPCRVHENKVCWSDDFTKHPDKYFNGDIISTSSNIEECRQSCEENTNCEGYDVSTFGSCWIVGPIAGFITSSGNDAYLRLECESP